MRSKLSLFFRVMAVAALAVLQTPARAESDELHFKVQGTNPSGKGGYTGEVTVSKTSNKQSARVHWVTGSNKAVTEGIAIRTPAGIIGAGYGGKAFYALAVYHLEGNHIHASWALANTPEEVGEYDLKGSDYDGKCQFADGSGSVTFTEGKDGMYKIVWDLPSGQYQGIGLRIKDSLVAASGDLTSGFGVVALQAKGDEIAGLWTTAGSGGVGKETWTVSETQKVPEYGGVIGSGKTVEFAGDTYFLKDQKSAAGQPTSELREYLRKGEEWEDYRKMIAFRIQNAKASPQELAEGIIKQTKKEYPDSYTKLLGADDDSATLFFIVVKGGDAELNLWSFHRAKGGAVASAQFVLRNKPPYETQKKFKAEQDQNFDEWLAQIKKLGAQAEQYVAATANNSVDAAPAKDKGMSPELVKAIKTDLDKCGSIAQKFMGLLQQGKTAEAVKLLSDSAFTKMTREEFVAAIEKSNKDLGLLKSFTPDKGATDFGVKNSVMTFTLQADAEYENAKVREILSFTRNAQGEIEFASYDRKPKR